MIWMAVSLPIAVLCFCITTANARNHFSSGSIYNTIITTFFTNLDLINCPLSEISLPQSTLPAPSEGLSLQFLTIGRGTQNYTCATNTNTSTPEAIGATATLFDASCLAALDVDTDFNDSSSESQSLLHLLPDVLRSVPLGSADFLSNLITRVTGQDLVIGTHYFTADGVPFFDFRGSSSDSSRATAESWVAAAKDDDEDAPAKPGYGITGDVAWLKLTRVEGGISEVYRLHTSGGAAPATCEGMPEVFTVDYTSEYWFYG
ncbi:hypothetical protein BJY01DRAFT_17167 [Aspergillus pseudoustus]|uniref:Malate dehydrogenase n=1 Tax=Aspergillus pseudoustus TaxID=1810923 RepID=A0ABR4JKX9_9EURO